MEASFHTDVFNRAGICIAVPPADDRSWLHQCHLGQLLDGVFLAETRDGINAIIERHARAQPIEAVALAGTELPLRASTATDLPLLETTELNVRGIEQRLRPDLRH